MGASSVDGREAGGTSASREAETELLSGLIRIFSESPEISPGVDKALGRIADALRADVVDLHQVQDDKLVLLGHVQRFEGEAPGFRELPIDADSLTGRCVL